MAIPSENENVESSATRESQGTLEASESIGRLSDDDEARYILQYILNCRGSCHETTLLTVLEKLRKYSADEGVGGSSPEDLAEIIKGINVKLSPLGYKIVRVSHGMGKRAIRAMLKSDGLVCNNKFYVYVNTVSNDVSKLATRFSQREIEFIKWGMQQMCTSTGCEVVYGSPIVKEIDRVRNDISDVAWSRCITYSVASADLLHYEEMDASEIEDLLTQLCELKWFYKDDQGRVAMDLRCLVELEESLLSNGIPTCQSCERLAVQGVQCGACSIAWHVDCYQHYVTHVNNSCVCGKSIVEDGVYVV